MRISDWSSDVCSPDRILRLWDFTKAETRFQTEAGRSEIAGREQEVVAYLQDRSDDCENVIIDGRARDPDYGTQYWEVYDRRRRLHRLLDFAGTELNDLGRPDRIELARSEEHTSELQSLMRISYAVLSLQKT